jgi:aldehyde:ferredoxin oxidoreductase
VKNGCNGRILRVNLSDSSIMVEQPEEDFYRTYFGGWGFVAYYLLKELAPEVEPLSPENKLIFALGPVTGVPIGGSGRNAIGAKSPIGLFGEADVGGFWGAELKRAGYDAIIIEGKAQKPVYLWIRDMEAQIRDATHLWGKTTAESQEMIRQELGDNNIRTAQIGVAGENMVRYACIINDLKHAAGRCGIGAVMGLKNLKAVACRGHNPPEIADSQAVREIRRWLAENYKEKSGNLAKYGSGVNLKGSSDNGGLPTHNFRDGVFEGAEKISAETVMESIGVGMEGCYACPIRCKKVVEVEEPYKVDPIYGGPEYETLASLGSCCGIDDAKAIAKGHELCNAHSLDTISTGVSIAFAMECYEKGLLTKEDTDGLELNFGNAAAMVELIELIAHRKGFGDSVAEGVKRMSEKIGQNSEAFAVHTKGQEVPMHDPRARSPELGMSYVMSPTGADHVHTNLWSVFKNCATMCIYLPYDQEQMRDIVNGVTGWNLSIEEMQKVGERAMGMARAFNALLGLTAEDDQTAPRFSTGFTFGPREGQHIDLEELSKAKQEYYQRMGWDARLAVPTREKLEELEIGWVADKLAEYNKLP